MALRACCSAVRNEASRSSSSGPAGLPRRLFAHSGISGSETPKAASERGKNWEAELSSSREARERTCGGRFGECERKARVSWVAARAGA